MPKVVRTMKQALLLNCIRKDKLHKNFTLTSFLFHINGV